MDGCLVVPVPAAFVLRISLGGVASVEGIRYLKPMHRTLALACVYMEI